MKVRSTRFYRRNEAEVMKKLGFRPTRNSGSGWIEKEDGISEHCICQLKSTDKNSMSVKQNDLNILVSNANVAHKIPVFAIQFLNTDDVWLMVRPEDIQDVKGIISGAYEKNVIKDIISIDKEEQECYTNNVPRDNRKTIKARKQYIASKNIYNASQKTKKRR